jgi:hypothetical protein
MSQRSVVGYPNLVMDFPIWIWTSRTGLLDGEVTAWTSSRPKLDVQNWMFLSRSGFGHPERTRT